MTYILTLHLKSIKGFAHPNQYEANYERHVVNKHPEKRACTCKPDLERLGLKSQGKSWEI